MRDFYANSAPAVGSRNRRNRVADWHCDEWLRATAAAAAIVTTRRTIPPRTARSPVSAAAISAIRTSSATAARKLLPGRRGR